MLSTFSKSKPADLAKICHWHPCLPYPNVISEQVQVSSKAPKRFGTCCNSAAFLALSTNVCDMQVAHVDTSPINYHFDVHIMSSEMVPFKLPMLRAAMM